MRDRLLVFINDFPFRRKIDRLAASETLHCWFTSRGDHLTELVKNLNPVMLIVEFSLPEEQDWTVKHVSEIKAERVTFPVVAVISRRNEVIENRARRAGCDYVFEKSVLLKRLLPIIRLYS